MEYNEQELQEYYHDIIMDYPLNTETVWDIEFKMRDYIEEKGYGIINYCNYPLIIKDKYMGHYNSISGDSYMIKLLYSQIKSWGYLCYYRKDIETPSKAYIIFPKNVVCEICDDLYSKLKYEKEVNENGVLY